MVKVCFVFETTIALHISISSPRSLKRPDLILETIEYVGIMYFVNLSAAELTFVGIKALPCPLSNASNALTQAIVRVVSTLEVILEVWNIIQNNRKVSITHIKTKKALSKGHLLSLRSQSYDQRLSISTDNCTIKFRPSERTLFYSMV